MYQWDIPREAERERGPLSLLPCSNCKKRPRGKLASVYLAWFAGSSRVSMKVRLCMPCASEYAEAVRQLKPAAVDDETVEWPESCAGCGGQLADDFDPTYLTVYMPSQEAVQLVLTQCGACALHSRPPLSEMGERLVDRQADGRSSGGLQAPRQVQAIPDLQWTL